MKRSSVAVAALVGIFLVVQLGALALVEPFKAAGFQTVEDPSDPTNSLVYILAILVATALMLAAFKFGVDGLIRVLVVGSAAYISFFVFSVLLPSVSVFGLHAPAVAGALLIGVALFVYPEWYVIDAAGIVMGAGAAGLFGISFGLLPALLLLTALAIYDAISVYGTKHMLTLASGVMDLKIPVILVIPLSLSYSYLDAVAESTEDDDADSTNDVVTGGDGEVETEGEAPGAESGETPGEGPSMEDRDAFFIGLGDAIMPTVLVASAGFFAPASVPSLVPGLALTLPALTALIGTLVGLLVLMRLVMQGRAHAGLPLLNGGAIAGYLLGAVIVGIPLVEAVGLAPYL
ncbi:presenilin family intramembrane aspartyl protease PSH [Natronomonas sp. EA1]|uniref:presenilin family intramembrane aspartyl protease PSH n=1 Tax=Natronomonas sp. EA1 TaxID=3421655 RepID=UPI003EB8DF0F